MKEVKTNTAILSGIKKICINRMKAIAKLDKIDI